MALTGTYTRTLDEKSRLAIPKRIREEFSNAKLGNANIGHLYIAPGTEQSLLVYSEEGFENMAASLSGGSRSGGSASSGFASSGSSSGGGSSVVSPELRKYFRFFYSQAERVDLDKQARVRIPERLAKFAGLDKEVVLLGVNDHAEIWSASHWNDFLSESSSDFDTIVSNAIQ